MISYDLLSSLFTINFVCNPLFIIWEFDNWIWTIYGAQISIVRQKTQLRSLSVASRYLPCLTTFKSIIARTGESQWCKMSLLQFPVQNKVQRMDNERHSSGIKCKIKDCKGYGTAIPAFFGLLMYYIFAILFVICLNTIYQMWAVYYTC